jgi:probable addiction module antidote protein
LLCAGDKSTQQADIKTAKIYLKEYLNLKSEKTVMGREKNKIRTRESATADYRNSLVKDLQDPGEAIALLNVSLEDDDHRIFLLALRDVADAQGISQVAERSGLNRENLYRILSTNGNPRLSSFLPLLKSLGLELSIKHPAVPATQRSRNVSISPGKPKHTRTAGPKELLKTK